jgi:hypothetical protein
LTIREALAARALHGNGRTLRIVEAEPDPMIVAKVELGKITMQMFLAAMLVDGKRCFDPILMRIA